MVSPSSSRPRRLPLQEELVAMSDAALWEYMGNLTPDEYGEKVIRVQDAEIYSSEFTDKMIRIYKTYKPRPSVQQEQSGCVDLDAVSSRLQALVTDEGTAMDDGTTMLALRTPSPRLTPLKPEHLLLGERRTPDGSAEDAELGRLWMIEDETICYEALVRAGGRPAFPVEQLEAMSLDPSAFCDVLLPHDLDLATKPSCWVFHRQYNLWRWFRIHQRKRRLEAREFGDGGLERYNENVRLWLATWDVVADREERPFRLERNPARQDELTTWLEFVAYLIEDDGVPKYSADKLVDPCRQNLHEFYTRRTQWHIDQIAVVEAETRQRRETEEQARRAAASEQSTARRAREPDATPAAADRAPAAPAPPLRRSRRVLDMAAAKQAREGAAKAEREAAAAARAEKRSETAGRARKAGPAGTRAKAAAQAARRRRRGWADAVPPAAPVRGDPVGRAQRAARRLGGGKF